MAGTSVLPSAPGPRASPAPARGRVAAGRSPGPREAPKGRLGGPGRGGILGTELSWEKLKGSTLELDSETGSQTNPPPETPFKASELLGKVLGGPLDLGRLALTAVPRARCLARCCR